MPQVLSQAGNGIYCVKPRGLLTSAVRYLMKLVKLGVLRCFKELLDVGEAKINFITLDAIETIIIKLHSTNLIQIIDDLGGVDLIEKLQEHQHQKVHERAVSLIEKYFSVEKEEDLENIAPTVQWNTFSFGLPTDTMERMRSRMDSITKQSLISAV